MPVADRQSLLQVLGSQDENRKLMERELDVRLSLRDNSLVVTGDPDNVQRAAHMLTQLLAVVEQGKSVSAADVHYLVRMIKSGEDVRDVEGLFTDTILVSERGKPIGPRTVGQKRYVEAMRRCDLVFSIGPAGTGKTFLAVAMAVAALKAKKIARIILTRPAVEAGERLGFLPGDLQDKVDPYLRPLYDALYEMLDMDKAQKYLERRIIEVAPLAYMRGRAQPVFSCVLTPLGWREIGSLRVGDAVIGSDGQPTQVLGVYPQGEKEVFQVTMTDNASTLCCAEHLWTVFTPDDRVRGKSPRVLETRKMINQLRRGYVHRFEVPLLSRPLAVPSREVPLDPYALGLLLGDGCLTGGTTPTFTTSDLELASALEARLKRIQLVPKSSIDYVLRHTEGGRGRRRIPNPVTEVLRDLRLIGTRSNSKFVPERYLDNAPSVRLAVLQGLLDTDGSADTQEGRSCRISYSTTSAQLRDDVIFLVRSLGGIVYCRHRPAEGRSPGRAGGRDVYSRSDTYVLDIRFPSGIEPFRLTRKAEKYALLGGGRPMRFIDRIEPAGVAETVCIQVAAPDSLYVTDDFILTHNTLNDSFIIMDEAQNTTTAQMKMFLTRMGFGSKVVVTGDVTQTDLPSDKASGLNAVRDILVGVEGIEFIYLTDRDVVRHKLVQRIIQAYELFESKQKASSDSKASALATNGQEEEQPDVQPTQEEPYQNSALSPAS